MGRWARLSSFGIVALRALIHPTRPTPPHLGAIIPSSQAQKRPNTHGRQEEPHMMHPKQPTYINRCQIRVEPATLVSDHIQPNEREKGSVGGVRVYLIN